MTRTQGRGILVILVEGNNIILRATVRPGVSDECAGAYVIKVADDVDLALVRLHEFFGCVDESGFDKYFDRSVLSRATIVNLAHSSKSSFTQDFEQLEFIPEPSAYCDLWWQEKAIRLCPLLYRKREFVNCWRTLGWLEVRNMYRRSSVPPSVGRPRQISGECWSTSNLSLPTRRPLI